MQAFLPQNIKERCILTIYKVLLTYSIGRIIDSMKAISSDERLYLR